MIEKHATAVWTGGLKDGSGTLDSQSGALKDLAYSFATRFEEKSGSNPEELIGAAHAGCYAMFLSGLMGRAQIVPERIEARSTITLDPATEGGPTVTTAHLTVTIKADAPAGTLHDLAQQAKAGCPVSKLLKAEVTLEVRL